MNFLIGYFVGQTAVNIVASIVLVAVYLLIGIFLFGSGILTVGIVLLYKVLRWTVRTSVRLIKFLAKNAINGIKDYKLYRDRHIIEANRGFIEC